ncbi:MAG: hypothetical protein L0Y56_16275 [Nitrospira sp.]|nr:hypothetical protein [Nitrospira sp.]
MAKNEANMDEYVRLAYQSSLEDIRFFKKQQWTVTNYTILLYVSIIALARYVNPSGNVWLSFITGIIGLLALFVILLLQGSIEGVYAREEKIRKYLDKYLNSDVQQFLYAAPCARCSIFKHSVLVILLLVVVGGGIATVWTPCSLSPVSVTMGQMGLWCKCC